MTRPAPSRDAILAVVPAWITDGAHQPGPRRATPDAPGSGATASGSSSPDQLEPQGTARPRGNQANSGAAP